MIIPLATYRVQFNRNLRFRDSLALLPYLTGLGITHLYASPIFRARPGSQHGYDVTDPTQLNPELGTREDFDTLAEELKRNGINILLDIVPNHMAANSENPWWTDVLENGSSSRYASYFDINWDPAQHHATPLVSARLDQEERVLLPILGAPYGTVLENQELELVYEPEGFFIRYYEAKLPVDPSSYPTILRHGLEQWEGSLWPEHPAVVALAELVVAFDRLPPRNARDWDALSVRLREQKELKKRLRELCQIHPEISEQIRQSLEAFRGRKGDAHSFDLLDSLISQQPYVLAFWKVAREKINYRRFFDVSDLVGLRVEDEEVQNATHSLIYELVESGAVTGLRVDHIDGLYDPQLYLERLRAAAPDSYLVVEKVLLDNESLPRSWPVSGTTGYDFLCAVNNLFVNGAGLDDLTRIYARFTGITSSFNDVVYEQKKRMIDQLFAGEVLALGLHLSLLAEGDRYARDLSTSELRQALIELTACMPVYRTYIRDQSIPPRDYAFLQKAFEEARRRNPEISPGVFDFLEQVLLLRVPEGSSEDLRAEWQRFVMRWQQLTGPVTAKGVEDTALYIYNRLVSLNDVGGSQRAISPEEFHRFNASRRARWPVTMNATSTHDTKRSEDVRARINVISEMPAEWTRAVLRWRRANRPFQVECGGRTIPDSNDEYLIYQTLVGAWPIYEGEIPSFRERIEHYVVKAAREAKTQTSWLRPDERYETCLVNFVRAILTDGPQNQFLPEFLKVQKKVAYYGAINSLSQVLLKIASPGVPDFYQGSLLWDFSLVDPDNRRPVDFESRLNFLDELHGWKAHDRSGPVEALLSDWQDGGVKLYVTYKGLRFRHARPELFIEGDYLPLMPEGLRRENVVAFARRRQDQWVIAAVPRLLSRLSTQEKMPFGKPTWRDTVLRLPHGAPSKWFNVLTGEYIAASPQNQLIEVHRLFQRFPVALLSAEGGLSEQSVS